MIFPFRNTFGRHRLATRAATRRTGLRTRQLQIECLEMRHLLTAGAFLQGVAYIDINSNHQLDAADTRFPGATVKLLSGNTLVGQAITDAQGKYLFDDTHNVFSNDLMPGTYTMVEMPPAGFVNSSAQANSQVNPAIVLNPMTIQVTIVDPAQLFAHFDGPGAGVFGEMDSLVSGFAGILNFHVDQTSTPTLPSPLHPEFPCIVRGPGP